MREDQRLARIFGVLYLVTFVTSIAALGLYQPILDDPASYIAGSGHDTKIYLAALLELFLIISNVGTAVVPFPIFRRQNEVFAVGYVAARIIESTFIAMGIIFALGVVSLRHDSPDAGHLALVAKGADVLGLTPVLDLGLGLGEGANALAALPLLRTAIGLAAAAPVHPALLTEPGDEGLTDLILPNDEDVDFAEPEPDGPGPASTPE